MEKQIPFYPTGISRLYEYFDGVVTWDLMNTTDEFYNDVLSSAKPSGTPGVFKSKHFAVKLVWMDVEEYIDYQIRILHYNDPAQLAFDLAISGESHEDYLDDPDYDPFIGFEMSASADVVQSIVNGIAHKVSIIPAGILIYEKDGTLSDFQEGRHRSLALHIMEIPLLPVWTFRAIKTNPEISQHWLDRMMALHPEGLDIVSDD